jgi:hypothetical protein
VGLPHLAFHLRDDEFEGTIGRLAGAAARLVREPSSRSDAGHTVRAALFADPAGNVVELTTMEPLASERGTNSGPRLPSERGMSSGRRAPRGGSCSDRQRPSLTIRDLPVLLLPKSRS